MNEQQKKVIAAMQKFFENFRKKHGVAVAKRAAGNKKLKHSK